MNPSRPLASACSLAFFFLCSSLFCLHGQSLIWEEQFNEASLNPARWTVEVDSTSDGWRLGEVAALSSSFFRIPANGRFIATNDDACGPDCKKNPDRLRSLAIELPNQATELSIRYFFQSHQHRGALERAELVIWSEERTTIIPLLNSGSDWRTQVISLSAFQGQSITIELLYFDGSGWNLGLALDAIAIRTIPALAAQITEIEINQTPPILTPTRIGYKVKNSGTDTIQSIRAFWRCENCPDTTLKVDHWVEASLAPQETKTFFHAIPFIGQLAQTYQLSFGIDSLNGLTPSMALNPQWRLNVQVVQFSEPRKHLLAYSTSASCGLCPDFMKELPQVSRNFPRLLPLGIHVGDSLSLINNSTFISRLGLEPLPAARLNLSRTWNRQLNIPELIDSLEHSGQNATAQLSLAQLDRKLVDTMSFSANVLVRALSQVPARHSLHMQVYIREDSIQRTGMGYDQLNFDGSFLRRFRHRWVSRYSFSENVYGLPLSETPIILDSNYVFSINVQLPADANLNRCVMLPVLYQFDSTTNKWSVLQADAFPISSNLRKPTLRLTRFGTLGCTSDSVSAWLQATTNLAIDNPQYTWFRNKDTLQLIGPRIAIKVDSLVKYKVHLTGTIAGRAVELRDSLTISPFINIDFSSSGRRFPVDSTVAVVEVPVRFEALVFPPGEYAYLWEFGDSLTDTLANPLHIYRQRGIYNVSLTVRDTCNQVMQYTKKGWVEIGSISVSRPITQNQSSKQLEVFPNPASDYIRLRWRASNADYSNNNPVNRPDLHIDKVACWNANGQQVNLPVLSGENPSNQDLGVYDVSHLANGLYLLVIDVDGVRLSYKIMIER
jgi:hypothetical protein